jgi:tetratricopeptide (TPR) repeat protein/Zn-dependent protease
MADAVDDAPRAEDGLAKPGETPPQADARPDPGKPPAVGPARRRRRIDLTLSVCILWLLAFPLLAALVASGEPIDSSHSVAIPALDHTAQRLVVHAVPVFPTDARPPGAVMSNVADMRRALLAASRAVVGRRRAPALVDLAAQTKPLHSEQIGAAFPYPFHYAIVERLLGSTLNGTLSAQRMRAADDLGAMLIEAAAMPVLSGYQQPFPQAGPVAFAILDRARSEGSCAPQLNLAFLLSTDYVPHDSEVKLEFERAARACPTDPTPLWLLGEYQSERAGMASPYPLRYPQPSVGVQAPFATFALLRKRFPGSAAGWAGAGDAELRLAYQVDPQEPFTARLHFQRALAFFLAAKHADVEVAAGTARAYAGLQQFTQAVAAQREAIAGRMHDAPLQTRLVEYMERARSYGHAAEAAAPLTVSARFPTGEGQLMEASSRGPLGGQLYTEEANGPLSIGADRFNAVSINLDDPIGGAGGGGVNDLSFIPSYREVQGVTGYSHWCPQWSMRRDKILAGRPAQALEGMPSSLTGIKPGEPETCASTDLLAGIAAYEAGEHERAIQFVQRESTAEKRAPLVKLDDARQNLWRFAGNLARARIAAREWRTAAPEEALAFDDSGEIEFLAGRYDPAARFFAQAVSLARAAAGLPSVAQSEALLKRGVALTRLGRDGEALRTLEEADTTAEEAQGIATHTTEGELIGYPGNAAFMAYNALAQIGYLDLSEHRFALAAEAYEAAVEPQRTLYGGPELSQEDTDPYTAVYNNLSLAQAEIGELHEALNSAHTAVAVDPMSPLTLATEGYALARLGRWSAARAPLASAVEQLPSQFSTWNDLGVVEARLGRRSAATDDFRRAVGANSEYPLGWFNLGVVLEQQGLQHALAAQGAFGRAIASNASLRERTHELSLDNDVYLTNLDLSKPLPANWSFTAIQRRPPATSLGIVLLLLAALQIGRTLAGSQSFGATQAQWLLTAVERLLHRLPGRSAFTSTPVTVIACGAVFLWPLLRAGPTNAVEVTLLLIGVGAIVLAVSRGRVLMARRHEVALEQRGWRPAIAVGLATALLGAAWAPLPVAKTDRDVAEVHWVGPCISAAISACLLLLSVLLEVPIARTLGGVALVMTASMLVPIKPLDGGVVAEGETGKAAGLAFLGGGLFLLLGVW